MVMEGQGADWAWLAIGIPGRDATANDCNQLLSSLFNDDEHPPESLVDDKSISQALRAFRRRGIEIPSGADMAKRTVESLVATKEGRLAIRDQLRTLSKEELSDLLQVEITERLLDQS